VDEVPDRPVIDLDTAFGGSATRPRKVKSCCLSLKSSQARCSPTIAFGLWPPIWPGKTLPVSRNRRTQLIAVLIPTENAMLPCATTGHPRQPPQQPALEDRANMVVPFLLASSPASRLNQKLADSGIPADSA
jgi:hypothetical protein